MQDIEFRAEWVTTSLLIAFVVPAQVLLFLKDRYAYVYMAHEFSASTEVLPESGSGDSGGSLPLG